MNTAKYTPIVLSHFQTSQLLQARDSGKQQAETSPNLGRTTVEVNLTQEGVTFPGNELLYWMDIESINNARTIVSWQKVAKYEKSLSFQSSPTDFTA